MSSSAAPPWRSYRSGCGLCVPTEAGAGPGSCRELQGGSQQEAPMCCSLLQTPRHQKVLQEPSQAPECFFSQTVS